MQELIIYKKEGQATRSHILWDLTLASNQADAGGHAVIN
jgi:hypothetical protein